MLLLPVPASRREFLRQLFFTAGAVSAGPLLSACGNSVRVSGGSPARAGASRFADIGPLGSPDENGIRLPTGFRSRVVAVSGEAQPGSGYAWHPSPDAGATYAAPEGGWVYVNNSEAPAASGGGAGALRFDAQGNVVDGYRVLANSNQNCAGGQTPWGTWLSCEELPNGLTYECDPFGSAAGARALPALGLFSHEAVAVDPVNKILYLTEDFGDGRFYRFVASVSDWPAGADRPAMQSGRLQVLRYTELQANEYPPENFDVSLAHPVAWEDVVSPELPQAGVRNALAGAGQSAPGTAFDGGEGLWYFQGIVYFSTKGDNRIWAYDHASQTLEAIYDFAKSANPILSGVDNLTVSSAGDVLVAEDGGDMQLCVILPDRRVLPVLQVTGQDASEITGPAFSPDGRRLYFNSQRGARNGAGTGITYEILLPFTA